MQKGKKDSGAWNNGGNAGPSYFNNNNRRNSNNNVGVRARGDDMKAISLPVWLRPAGTAAKQVVSLFILLRRIQAWIGITVCRAVIRLESRALILIMGKRYKNLMGEITAEDNLRLAYKRARSGKRFSFGHLLFKEHSECNLMDIREKLLSGSYTVSPYNSFLIYEPKQREIMALPFYDRVVQHALVNVVGPIFDKVFMPVSYACREGYGSHLAVVQAQAAIRRFWKTGEVFCLKMDFSKYFSNIDREILHEEIRRKIGCAGTLGFIETITSRTGTGLPIGNLTSQLWANLYGHIWDRWLVHEMGVRSMFRYMDDTLIFSNSREWLVGIQKAAAEFIRTRLRLQFSKWDIFNVSRGVPFLGYRIWKDYKLIRRDSVTRAKRKIDRFRRNGDFEGLAKFLASWKGHIRWASCHNLEISLGV